MEKTQYLIFHSNNSELLVSLLLTRAAFICLSLFSSTYISWGCLPSESSACNSKGTPCAEKVTIHSLVSAHQQGMPGDGLPAAHFAKKYQVLRIGGAMPVDEAGILEIL